MERGGEAPLNRARVGVLGGTFNPIHCGHLHIAREVQSLFSLEQVHFVVALNPPHKSPSDLLPFAHRYAMASLATAGFPGFIPSPIEVEPGASSYTIDTMDKLKRRVGGDGSALFFIAGGDSLPEVRSWRQGAALLGSYNFVFVTRPGVAAYDPADALPPDAVSRVRDLTGLSRSEAQRVIADESGCLRIFIVDVGAPDISATEIRRLVLEGMPVDEMAPGPVREYIDKLKLYGGR